MKIKKYTNICIECNKSFQTNREIQKYCSDYCRYHKRYYEPKHCLECNEIFKPKRTNQKYCSQRCSSWHFAQKVKFKKQDYRRKHPLKYPINSCEYCNKNFERKNSFHKFCSVECRIKKYKMKTFNSKCENQQQHYLKMRFLIFKRDEFTCKYCGRSSNKGAKLQIDHIHPRSKGGLLVEENLITACFECNQGKKDIVLSERELSKVI